MECVVIDKFSKTDVKMKSVVITLLIVAVLILLLYRPDKQVLDDTEENMAETSRTIAEIHTRITALIEFMGPSDKIANALRQKYAFNTISEAVIQAGYSSYTVDKSRIHLCMRTRDTERKIYDVNTLMYVVLHELAHLVSVSVGHTDEFKDIFRHLVVKAIDAGLYTRVDYSVKNIDYCGLTLKTSIV